MEPSWSPETGWTCSSWAEEVVPWLGRLYASEYPAHSISAYVNDVQVDVSVEIDDKEEEQVLGEIVLMVVAALSAAAPATSILSVVLVATTSSPDGTEVAHTNGPVALRMVRSSDGAQDGESQGGDLLLSDLDAAMEAALVVAEFPEQDEPDAVVEPDDVVGEKPREEDEGMGPLDESLADTESAWERNLGSADPELPAPLRDPAVAYPRGPAVPNAPGLRYPADEPMAAQSVRQPHEPARPPQVPIAPQIPIATDPQGLFAGFMQIQAQLQAQQVFQMEAANRHSALQGAIVTQLLAERRFTQGQQRLDSAAREATFKATIADLSETIRSVRGSQKAESLRREAAVEDSHRRQMEFLSEGTSRALDAHTSRVAQAEAEMASTRRDLQAAQQAVADALLSETKAKHKLEEVSRTENPTADRLVTVLDKAINTALLGVKARSKAAESSTPQIPDGPYTLLNRMDYADQLSPGQWPVICGVVTEASNVQAVPWSWVVAMGLQEDANAQERRRVQMAEGHEPAAAPPAAPPSAPRTVQAIAQPVAKPAEDVDPNTLDSTTLAAGLSMLSPEKLKDVLSVLNEASPDMVENLRKMADEALRVKV